MEIILFLHLFMTELSRRAYHFLLNEFQENLD